MKILYISNGYPPHRWAGTETYTAGLARGFQSLGHDVQVLCAGEWEQRGLRYWYGFSDESRAGINVRRIHLNWKKAPDPFGYLYDNPVVAAFLSKYLAQLRPDVVHVTSCETLSASVLRVIHKTGLPLILSLTDFWFLCPRLNLLCSDNSNCDGLTSAWDCMRCQLRDAKIYRWSRRLLPEPTAARLITRASRHRLLSRQRGLRGMVGDIGGRKRFLRAALSYPNCRITASPFVRKVHQANGVSVPIMVKPYGHDLDWTRNYGGKTASDVVRIGYIGQIIPSKGLHVLLQAARSLEPDLRARFGLRIYGNLQKLPEYGARILSLAEEISNIQFLGLYPHNESSAVFANIDVLVVPSLWYDFPLVIHEAFATSTPVIASNLGPMAEVVDHEVNGLRFEPGDSTDLARQLRRAIEEKRLLSGLRAGVPKVKTIDEEMNELECVYRNLSGL